MKTYASFYGTPNFSRDDLIPLRPSSRNSESEPLPPIDLYPLQDIHGLKGFFSMPLLHQAMDLGPEALKSAVHYWAVKTPGTLGVEGSWRIDGHRIALSQILSIVYFADPRHQSTSESAPPSDPATWAVHHLVDYFDWSDNLLTRDRLFAACAFALLYPTTVLQICEAHESTEMSQAIQQGLALRDAYFLQQTTEKINSSLPSVFLSHTL